LEADSRAILEALVVKAVLEGHDTREAVLERLKTVDPREVEEAIDRLIAEGALREVEEGRIFKRRRLVATRKGLEKVAKAKALLEEARKGRISLDLDSALLALAFMMLLGAFMLDEALEAHAHGEAYEGEEPPEEGYEEPGGLEDVDMDIDLGM